MCNKVLIFVTFSEGLKPDIIGPNYVTVGVPSSIECGSSCGTCTYSMSLDGQSAVGQSNMLAFTINSWVPSLTVTCTVSGDNGLSATATKNIQVLGMSLLDLLQN